MFNRDVMAAKRLGSLALPVITIAVLAWVGYVYLIKTPQRVERAAEITAEARGEPEAPPAKASAARADDLSIEAELLRLEREPAPPDAAETKLRDEVTRAEEASNPRTPSLSGTWNLATRGDSASREEFEGMQLGYRLRLTHDGDRISGRGEKRTENGRGLQGEARTPIEVSGSISGRRLELTFTEQGAERSSGGRMSAEITAAGELRGTFTSDAARSRGSLYARRAP